MVGIIHLHGGSRFNGALDPYYSRDFESDGEWPIEMAYSEVSDELDQKRQKVDWDKTNAYKSEKTNEYYKGVDRLRHNYIKEQEQAKRMSHNRDQRNNASR